MSNETKQVETKPPQKRKIDLKDVEQIAAMVALKLSEASACRKIGLNPQSWFKWKCVHRNDDRFSALLEKLRAEKLVANLENIEDASKGKNGHRPDWRASSWLVERALTSDSRYSDRVIVQQGNAVIDMNIPGMGQVQMLKSEWSELCTKSIAEGYAKNKEKQKTLDVASETKLLSEPGKQQHE